MEDAIEPFEFKQAVSILKSTGKRANSIHSLRDLISRVSDESIFHHMSQYFLKEHILGYTNDFAQWAGESLEERALAERLSNVDPYACKSIAHTRKEVMRVIDDYLSEFPEPRCVLSGDEFYFNETITLIFPVGIKVKNLADFLMALRQIDPVSIYFHFYEARIRLGKGIDDFSRWFKNSLNRKKLVKKIKTIDPFMHNIDGIREHIIEMIEEDMMRDMGRLRT
ncbi:MAG: DUF5752 family protein [Candidatus Mariimomonas ferrooxydans]